MSDLGLGNSPGRQRRSTERSRENIRDYVKLLGRKFSETSEQISPRSSEGKSPVSTSSKSQSDEERLEEEASSTQLNMSEKQEVSLKEKLMECSVAPEESPKASRKLDTKISSTSNQDPVDHDPVKNEKVCDSKIKTDIQVIGEKSVITSELGTISSPDKDRESKQNSLAKKDDKNILYSDTKNKDVTEGFCGFDSKEMQKCGEANRTAAASTSSKRSTPKSEQTEPKSDSPPDLILFLKEGRGRAQNWSEPPTLDPESIATRRRTRVPEDPKALAQSKLKSTLQDKSKKDYKEMQKKDGKKDKKIKVMDTPESLKRLAQDYPLKDSTKLSCTSKQEISESNAETKMVKKIIAKNVKPSECKAKIIVTPASSDDELETNLGKRRQGKKKTVSGLSSVKSVDNSKGSPKVPQSSNDTLASETSYLNLDTILHQMSENKADSRIPVVIMSNSDGDGNANKAMPRSKKKATSPEKADKAVLKMAVSIKSDSDEKQLSKENVFMEDSASHIKNIQKASELNKEEVKITEYKGAEHVVQVSPSNVVVNVDSKDDNKEKTDSVHCKATQSLPEPLENNIIKKDQTSETSNTAITKSIPTKSQSMIKVPVSKEGGINHRAPRPVVSSTSGSQAVFTSSMLKSPVKASGTQSSHKPPLVVSVSDFLSFRVAAVNSGASNLPPRKLNLKIPNLKGIRTDQLLRNTVGLGKESLIIKGGILHSRTKIVSNNGDGRSHPQVFSNQLVSLSGQKGPMLDYTDIEPEEVVVGESEDSSSQMLSVGELPAEIDLRANEQLDSSSEEESTKVPEPLPSLKKDVLSPEGRVALDHSYSSGNMEKPKASNITQKKSPVSYEKTLTPRPVYSSASVAKRSLDIMLHNDKINILRQMSQIFNHEKPVQPDTDNTVSSSDGEDEEDMKANQINVGINTNWSKLTKEFKHTKDVIVNVNDPNTRKSLSEGSKINIELDKSSKTIEVHSAGSDMAPALLITSDKNPASPSKISSLESNVDITKRVDSSSGTPKDAPSSSLEVDSSVKTSSSTSSSTANVPEGKKDKNSLVRTSGTVECPFLGFPDTEAKVHHVPAYSVALDEMIHVQSTIGPEGEVVDIVDGFAFISFSTEKEMNTYSVKQNTRGEKGHRPWLRKKKKKRRKLFCKVKKSSRAGGHEVHNLSESASQLSRGKSSTNDTGAFASNDLEDYLNLNSHLNISYTIPKCKATEEGVTKLDEDGLPQENKFKEIPVMVPESILMQSQVTEALEANNTQPSVGDSMPDQVQQYEEVNAIDILYPKEKYKYYYNKELCKETKADGSNVFVRRAGKLVPLTSILNSQKPKMHETSNKETAELVYIYDRGKLITLGGSLTKINPSNSDSVRARVILPIGTPPIMKGEVQRQAKKVQAVEINEDMAKFALSALQSPNAKEEKLEVDKKCENQETIGPSIINNEEKVEKSVSQEKCEEKEVSEKVPEKVSVVPTKRNILDIIAAKLAMSDEESDERDDKMEEHVPNIKSLSENIVHGDEKSKKSVENVDLEDKKSQKYGENIAMGDEKRQKPKENISVGGEKGQISEENIAVEDEKCQKFVENVSIGDKRNQKSVEDVSMDDEKRQKDSENNAAGDEKLSPAENIAIEGQKTQKCMENIARRDANSQKPADKISIEEKSKKPVKKMDVEEKSKKYLEKIAVEENKKPVEKITVEDNRKPVDKTAVEENKKPVDKIAVEENKKFVDKIAVEENKKPVDKTAVEENKKSVDKIAVEENKKFVDKIAVEENKKPVDKTAVEENKKSVDKIAVEENKKFVDKIAVEEDKKPVDKITVEENKKPVDKITVEENKKPVKKVAVEEKSKKLGDEDGTKNRKRYTIKENSVKVENKEAVNMSENKVSVTCLAAKELKMTKEEPAVEVSAQKLTDLSQLNNDDLDTKEKPVDGVRNDQAENNVKKEGEVKESSRDITRTIDAEKKEVDKLYNNSAIKDDKDQIKDLVGSMKELDEQKSVVDTNKVHLEESKGTVSKTCDVDADPVDASKNNSARVHLEVENGEENIQTSVPGIIESEKTADTNFEKAEGKSRVFKKNMYRFPSLSREMKRLNMNFVKYVMQENTAEDIMEKEVMKNCTNDYCKLGCVCDTLTCRRRSMEHCGRVECMFECSCRDESWKHSVSGTGRTMNAVSIYNLDREQNEGLALREKDFRKTVIQTGSEVILVGAERKKRERRIPGRYRDSALWTGSDYIASDSPCPSEPEIPPLPDFPSIPLSEVSRYIRPFKLNIPWYDIKGISVWCMDHSCYDCRCLKDVSYNTRKADVIEKSEMVFDDGHISNSWSAVDTFEEALLDKEKSALASPSRGSKLEHLDCPSVVGCSIVNVVVNNTEAKRNYRWKLKNWFHSMKNHCARTCGYSKKDISEETKYMTLSGLAAREITPEQMVETVVKSLRHPKENVHSSIAPAAGNFESFMNDSLVNLQNALGITSDNVELKAETLEISNKTVPLVDLTSSNLDELGISHSPSKSPKMLKKKVQKTLPDSPKDVTKIVVSKRSRSHDECSVSPSPKKWKQSSIQEESANQVSSSVVCVSPDENNASATPVKSVNNDKACEESEGKRVARKPLSLLEMMVAEEKRGELELDLTNNFPGNALLVAEARFRKLINMNIIGVVGINKAGRCIIGTVDSIESLRVMQRIHNMISNSTLDVGPNMREIFFPPPYTGTRPRFVMIRCDLNSKWEIVGVVQKKGPMKTSNHPEQKAKSSMTQKPSSFIPQVIDLEEEEKQKELQRTDKPDVVILPSEADGPDAGSESSSERDSGAWEGSLPLIASVHSASDSNMAELIGSPERICDSVDKLPLCESSVSFKQPSTTKSIPDLVPISTGSVEELNTDISQGQEIVKSQGTLPVSGIRINLQQQSDQQLYFVPTALKTSTKTTSTLPAQATSSPGMRTFKLNQSSGRVFGDSPSENLLSFCHSLASPVLSPQSSQSTVLDSGSSGKLPLIPKKGNSGSSTYSLSATESNTPFKDDSCSNAPKVNDGLVPSRRVLSPVVPLGTAVRAAMQTKIGDGIAVNQNVTASTTPSSKMLYIPVSSGCLSKMVFVPTVSGGPSPRMMLLPTIPSSSGGIDNSKMKMVLMPSAQDNSKMILLPATTDTGEALTANVPSSSGSSENDSKKMLVLPSNVLGNLIARPPSNIDQRSKILLPRPTILNDTPSFQSTCTGTLLVPIKSAGTLPLKSFQVDEVTSVEKDEDNIAGPELSKESSDPDNSDDVVVIGPVTNSLTITRVRTASESTFQRPELNSGTTCTSQSLSIVPAPSVSSSGKAETNVVSSVITVSSTMPGNTPLQKDSGTHRLSSNILHKQTEGNPSNSSEDMVIVKTSLNSLQLNALLQSTHKELLKTKDDCSVISPDKTLDSKEVPNKEEALSVGKHSKDHSKVSVPNASSVVATEQKTIDEIEEVGSKQVQIKKGGYHWSAVDLSLNFKSVKLEWLLGTIRKNVLMNIYRMSLKTHSPVTLSVKNGTSTSMLYGLARGGYAKKEGDPQLPILILGSVVSAVMSSSSTPDAVLFQVNAIKYFIRENTGELSSYTYDVSGDFLVKLASKKRGHGGEMIGIGEKVPIQKMRELSNVVDNSCNETRKTDTGNAEEKCTLPIKSKVQDCNTCSCTAAGDFLCMGHSASQLKVKDPTAFEIASNRPQSLNPEQSCTLVQEATVSSEHTLPQEFQPVRESNVKSSADVVQLECSSVPKSACSRPPIPVSPHLKQCPPKISALESSTSTMRSSLDQNSSQTSTGTQCSKDDFIPQSEKTEGGQSHEISGEGKVTSMHVNSALNNEEMNANKSYSLKYNDTPEKSLSDSPTNIIGIKELEVQATSNCLAEGSEAAKGQDIDSEIEDVDIMGDCDTDVSMSLLLRNQVTDQSMQGKVASTGQAKTPGEVARYLLKRKIKRKLDTAFSSFERPCPRSKKRLLNSMTRVAMSSSTLEDELPETLTYEVEQTKNVEASSCDPSSRLPSHLAHLRQSSSEEISIVQDDEPKPGPSSIKTPMKMQPNLLQGKSKLGKKVVRLKKREVKYVDVEGNNEQRCALVHNELERMRRRVIRHLFINLQHCIASLPCSPLVGETVSQPKIAILNAASKVCENLRTEEIKLWAEEERIRKDRSSLIKKLATVISDTPEEVRLRWRQWVHNHMQNPTAKQAFEKQWKPLELEKEIISISSGESSFDMDLDEGSPLPAPALAHPPAQPRTTADGSTTPVPVLQLVKSKETHGVHKERKIKKKLGRPHKIVVDTRCQSVNMTPEATSSIPTSILLMAGTSSRGRKIVRKEDMNFVS
ncbi:uncharacterized protein [Procambarus clarkii]|uniref:uncharacterized protein n=1 Tax=Procambarus clarkii TaxID=6728 RepID=UPI0037430595